MIYRDNHDYFSKKLIYFKGGGSDSVDEVYNAGMLELSQHQQGMADELFSVYQHGTGGSWEETQVETSPASTGYNRVWSGSSGKDGTGSYNNVAYGIPAQYETQRTWVSDGSTFGQQDVEQAQVDANMELIPGQTALSGEQTASARELLPGQTALAKLGMSDQTAMINERAPVRQAFYKEAQNGVNAEDRANKAAADAAHSFVNSNSVARRDSARMGVNPNSGRFKAMQNSNNIDRAKAIGGARTGARTQAENDNFGRLQTAMNYGG